MKYNFREIEEKWAKKWFENKTFSPDLKKSQNPYYALFMFPYPSNEGLHIGNFYAFTSVDVIAKYKKLKGFDVFEPIGFDSFGIHSENYALKIGETPRKMLDRTEANFRKQLVSSGIGCDWTREVNTTHPNYYKWTQWIFLQLYKKGLAFQKEALLNWCPSCKTVLADEQIVDGKCERCNSIPKKKKLKQWFFRITNYSQRLLDGLEEMDWSEITKSAQKNWIGRSEGVEIKFETDIQEISVFTTRIDTVFGVTHLVLSPEHPLLEEIVLEENKNEIKKYCEEAGSKSDVDRIESYDKTGVFTGAYAINPLNNEKIPIWVADYVLSNYGTGAVMAVPAHDERDHQFAKKYNIEIKKVVIPLEDKKEETTYTEDGILINSENYNNLTSKEAREKISDWLEKENKGSRKINYKLRDWCISRQRYWGPPIPIIYCDKCGTVPVPEADLPIILPRLEKNWEPSDNGKGPLSNLKDFVETECPKCGALGKRETDVMDNFLDSAWYFFRYLSPNNEKEILNKELGKKWLPVDIYIGGNEHAVLHLMYTRFITMVFNDLGLINFDNPFKKFRANGMILKDGEKMSKSKGNIVNPEEYGEKFGYDALKSYLMFLGPLSDDKSFIDSGILGTVRWIEKIYKLKNKVVDGFDDEDEIKIKFNKTIKELENDLETQKYNIAIARLMKLTNELFATQKISKTLWLDFLPLIAPFTPAIAEEMWENSGQTNSIFNNNWPKFDSEKLKNETINFVIQVNSKVRDVVEVEKDLEEETLKNIIHEREKVKKWIEGKRIKRYIFVKNKLLNIILD